MTNILSVPARTPYRGADGAAHPNAAAGGIAQVSPAIIRRGRKLDRASVIDIFIRSRRGEKLYSLAREYGVSEPMIAHIKHRTRWRGVTDPLHDGKTLPKTRGPKGREDLST